MIQPRVPDKTTVYTLSRLFGAGHLTDGFVERGMDSQFHGKTRPMVVV
jgi:hypothetical protein